MNARNADALAEQFGLASVPDGVRQLAGLLANRETNIEELAKIFAQNTDLVERLLRVANPRASRKEDYVATTIDQALHRAGMSVALLLAMSDPLIRAVIKTFDTMVAISLKAMPPKTVPEFKTEHVLGEVTFEGKTSGLVHLRLPAPAVALLGDRMLGLTPEDLDDPAVANDVLGELCNMIVGNFKSNLSDAGLACKLSLPRIARTPDFKLHSISGGTSERQAFRAQEMDLFADLSVNPWVGCFTSRQFLHRNSRSTKSARLESRKPSLP
jgi:CheY-specific phosphatase CheX